MIVPALACAFAAIWFLYRSLFKSTAERNSEPPEHVSWIPFVGHIVGIVSQGSNAYFSKLCATQKDPISTLKLPGQKIHLVHPQDKDSVKQFTGMHNLSLMTVFRVAIGPAMGLVPASEKALTDPDTGAFKKALSKLFNEELRSLHNLKKNAALLERGIGEYWDGSVKGQEGMSVGLGSWVFDMLASSMGNVFWGEKGPFGEGLFRENLRIFIQNLEAMQNPISFLIPKKLFVARDYVRQKIEQAVQDEAYGTPAQGSTLFEDLAHLYQDLEIPKSAFTDCHLVAIVGLMSNVINMVTWAICHIVADPELRSSILDQINTIVIATSETKEGDPLTGNLSLDANLIREKCPLLVATWYELLRLYGDAPVARSVTHPSLFHNRFLVQKNAFIMVPIHIQNFNTEIWGADAESFRPSRFLKEDGGSVEQELVKQLTVFGLPGMHQCPGRYLALNITLGVVAKVLCSFEFEGRVEVPGRKETMLGMPAMDGDPEVLVRREGVGEVRVGFEDVRPGW